MTTVELHKWLQSVWREHNKHRLLVLDQYRPYTTADTKLLAESLDTKLILFQEGVLELLSLWT